MPLAAVGGGLLAVVHAVVAEHPGHAQAVVGEDRLAALGLGGTVALHLAPFGDGLLVALVPHTEDDGDHGGS